MKKFCTFCSLTLCLALASAALGADVTKIGSVDIQKVLILSEAGKEAKETLAARGNKYEAEKNAREEELRKLKGELEKQSVLLSEDARKNKEQSFMQKRKELDRFLKDAQEDLQAKNDELTGRFVEEIVKIIQDYGKKNGYTYIFVKNDSMVYLDQKADLTEEVLKTFNGLKKK